MYKRLMWENVKVTFAPTFYYEQMDMRVLNLWKFTNTMSGPYAQVLTRCPEIS